ncbi:MAG: 4-hydroxy-3-methylbut-2-enyl diphosphate reductase [Deferribacteraceae bacterium]|jgi:4-hydroxy-3-methylbut-2-enyl diphosphate reductase|nr:4-hydroxy-3-methylbut-2-enyl diphosphate reductase [Deferribacteraceae bacterium]
MKVTVAEYAGFCFGVERAIKIVSDAAKVNENVTIYGPLIHNPQVVKELADSGVTVKKKLTDITPEMTVVVRTHGITINELEALKKRTTKVIDATCPFVLKAQTSAQNLSDEGFFVAVVGEAEHPEIQGIVSYIRGEYTVVAAPEDSVKLPWRSKYGLVAQTTQSEYVYQDVINILRGKCEDLNVAYTICSATHKRQEAALQLAGSADVMIVIGGRNSANTTRLYRLCKSVCERTYHIEAEEELNDGMFAGARHVGISAGASTPNKLVYDVRARILERAKKDE